MKINHQNNKKRAMFPETEESDTNYSAIIRIKFSHSEQNKGKRALSTFLLRLVCIFRTKPVAYTTVAAHNDCFTVAGDEGHGPQDALVGRHQDSQERATVSAPGT